MGGWVGGLGGWVGGLGWVGGWVGGWFGRKDVPVRKGRRRVGWKEEGEEEEDRVMR